MCQHKLFGDRKAQAAAAVHSARAGTCRRAKSGRRYRAGLRGDTCACIADSDAYAFGNGFGAQRDLSDFRRVAQGVRQQVGKYLVQAVVVGFRFPGTGREFPRAGSRFGRRRGIQIRWRHRSRDRQAGSG